MTRPVKHLFGWTIFVVVVTAVGLIPHLAEQGPYDALRPEANASSGAPLNVGSTDSFVVLIGAGDIANCDSDADERTASIVDSLLQNTSAAAWVITMGDNANPRGTERDFVDCYDTAWGRFRDITRPVTGNHDWKNGQWLWRVGLLGNAGPYFTYFNTFPNQTGLEREGTYRYRHGTWDIYALSTHPKRYIAKGEDVWQWLTEQLEESAVTSCALAYYHYPRFSVGKHGDDQRLTDVWRLLQENGIDILLSGHDHNYQRFAPQSAVGVRSGNGIRQFVVGTGGDDLRAHYRSTDGLLERWTSHHFGVLKLRLFAHRYAWEFITAGGEVWDAGSGDCGNDAQS